jgi:hypothetical protein
MNTTAMQSDNQDRLDVLLAMAIAFNQQKKESNAEQDSILSEVLSDLSALNEKDLSAAREKLGYYDALTDEEKRLWQARIIGQIANHHRLDKDVHHTQVAKVLSVEPDYVADYIIQRLSPEMAVEVAADLERSSFQPALLNSVHTDLESLLRRRFLSNFVGREDLYEVKPLAMLSGEDVLDLVQRLGRSEMAFVCRGVKDVESLAPFLRRFEPEDSQAILELMADLRTVEKKRLDKAEVLIKQAWVAEKHPTLVIQSVGLTKLAAALCDSDELTVRYTLQKMPVILAQKVKEKIEQWRKKADNTEIYQNEVETTAARILLDKLPRNSVQDEPQTEDANENAPTESVNESLEVQNLNA